MSLPTTGLLIWYKVDAGGACKDYAGTPCADGDVILQFRDQSGNNRHTTNPAYINRSRFRSTPAPTLGTSGLPMADFAVGGAGLQTGYSPAAPFTILCVYTGPVSGSHRAIDGSNNWLIGPFNGFNACYMGGFVSQNTSPAVVANTIYRTLTTNSGSVSTFSVDGVDYTTGGTNHSLPGTINFGAAGTQGQDLTGFLAEFAIWDHVLSGSDQTAALTYAARWTATLPSDNVPDTIPTALDTGIRASSGTYTLASEYMGSGPHLSGDIDMYKLNVTVPCRIDVDALDLLGVHPPALRLFDSAGNEIPSVFPVSAGSWIVLDAGDYYLGVTGDSSNISYNPMTGAGTIPGGPTYDYHITITAMPLPPDHVPDTMGTALDTRIIGTGTFDLDEYMGSGPNLSGDIDMYKFTVTGPSVLNVLLSYPGTTTSLDSYLRLFDETGFEWANNDDLVGSLSGLEDLAIETVGNYYLGITGYPNSVYDPMTGENTSSASSGPYHIHVNLLGPPAPPLPPPPVSLSTTSCRFKSRDAVCFLSDILSTERTREADQYAREIKYWR